MSLEHPTQTSITNLLKQVLSEVFFVDGRIFRTIKTLISQPGKLPLDDCSDQDLSGISPFRIFFGANLLFFFLIPILTTSQFQLFEFTLESLTAGNEAYQSVVKSQTQRLGISDEIYQERVNATLNYSKSAFMFLVVPIFALPLFMLNYRNRSYYYEHFVFSLHFFSFFLVSFIATVIAFRLGTLLAGETPLAVNLTAAVCLCVWSLWILLYLTLAMARFYKTRKIYCVLKLPVVLAGFILTFGLYAQFLFVHAVISIT